MREQVEPVKPGQEVTSELTWTADEPLRPGTRVEATDGVLGTIRERRAGEGPEHAYLGVDTDQGLYFVPDRLIRETRAGTVYLSIPRADVLANASHDELPRQPDPTHLPEEAR